MYKVLATITVAMLSGSLAVAEGVEFPNTICGIKDLDCEKFVNSQVVQLKEFDFPAALALSFKAAIDPTVLDGFQTGSAISLDPYTQGTDFDAVWRKLTAQTTRAQVLTNYHVAVYYKKLGYVQAPVYCYVTDNVTECSAENVGKFLSLDVLPDDSVLVSKDRKEFRDNGGIAVSIDFDPSASIDDPIFPE